MKNILISFIRDNHLRQQKEGNFQDIDISRVIKNNSIDRLFLLTNKNRDDSFNFKNWISEKLDIEVKAVTLEKGSEKYVLNKIESIIKYILLAEEGHAKFFYLPGENTLQINLWEIINKNIYNGKIIYPDHLKNKKEEASSTGITRIPIYNNTKEKKIFTVKKPEVITADIYLEKGSKSVDKGVNLLICGEEGTGKRLLAKKLLNDQNKSYDEINFKSINPLKLEDEFDILSEKMKIKENDYFLFLNIEVLPQYIQEKFSDFDEIKIISTFNINNHSIPDDLNRKFYYRISNSLISLKPLRARKSEFPLLIADTIMSNKSSAIISDNALELMKMHNWPGNFNELNSVISRVCIETTSVITAEIIENSIDNPDRDLRQWQSDTIGDNFNLNDILGDVAMHYIMLALETSKGKKSKAAHMLGFSNYQTLSNWIKKYQK